MTVNQTRVTYFIIKGVSESPELQVLIFLSVLLLFLISLGDNMIIFILICLDNHLHTPMYFFLANLSIVDISSSTATLYRILVNFITKDKAMGYFECMVQCYIIGSLSGHELFILTAMSWDRYVAICKPLSHHMIMNFKACLTLAAFCWLLGFMQSVPFCVLLVGISCYSSNEINHFRCDPVPLIEIACSDVSDLRAFGFIEGLIIYIIVPFSLTFISYFFIIVAILKIRSNSGKRKAFYTCSSHLMVIILHYVNLIAQYVIPNKSLESTKLISLFNTGFVPMVNPILYSLTNKDMKTALRRRLG